MTRTDSEHTVRVKGADIFVADTGGDGPTVVIAYDTAWPQTRGAVREVLATLLARISAP